MKRWKINQALYHKIEQPDDFLEKQITFNIPESEIEEKTIKYFHFDDGNIYMPAKIYAVAIIYSYLLSKYFDENFYTSLSDPNLLYDRPPEYKTYLEDKATYDKIIQSIDLESIEESYLPQVQITIECFYKEFMIGKHKR